MTSGLIKGKNDSEIQKNRPSLKQFQQVQYKSAIMKSSPKKHTTHGFCAWAQESYFDWTLWNLNPPLTPCQETAGRVRVYRALRFLAPELCGRCFTRRQCSQASAPSPAFSAFSGFSGLSPEDATVSSVPSWIARNGRSVRCEPEPSSQNLPKGCK